MKKSEDLIKEQSFHTTLKVVCVAKISPRIEKCGPFWGRIYLSSYALKNQAADLARLRST